jgi:hypothetical protein
MALSVLERLLVTERYRPRAAAGSGFSVPILLEREVGPEHEPLLVTNSRGLFVPTRRAAEGFARYAFFPCPLDEEDQLLVRLHAALWSEGEAAGWTNRAPTLDRGMAVFRGLASAQPSAVVVSQDAAALEGELSAEELDKLRKLRGHVAEIHGVRIYLAPLPAGCAIVAAAPKALGVYTRVGDHLGLQLLNVRRTLVVVKPDGVDR